MRLMAVGNSVAPGWNSVLIELGDSHLSELLQLALCPVTGCMAVLRGMQCFVSDGSGVTYTLKMEGMKDKTGAYIKTPFWK
jgi:hypothetical protein